jgi:hypothetical protein
MSGSDHMLGYNRRTALLELVLIQSLFILGEMFILSRAALAHTLYTHTT